MEDIIIKLDKPPVNIRSKAPAENIEAKIEIENQTQISGIFYIKFEYHSRTGEEMRTLMAKGVYNYAPYLSIEEADEACNGLIEKMKEGKYEPRLKGTTFPLEILPTDNLQ